ncbi:hypothetical protein KAFR_0F02050 [Kazachstania africana CBS 2517]|uniref:Manganese resistance protein MNR2 n=1 Tax=Kazachstania africana (strain ATCC 22294 / BCRC 22015 / CBS 2517 / CECT 1963 / NBRC 1671 / NRRL Y-8276) TaxID=1071382 RepID=H2AWQ2_KAZAF|nr:hypothetical protein KAFR_0F02050 [Kazachstania africana CBS 2517]CCF58802.1 hypothetical protein KAFR_0F02050 [Kazachstania africana CBS 2517]
MGNPNGKKQDKVPLLSSKNKAKRISSISNRNPNFNDFNHVDSWGMLHESDNDYDSIYDFSKPDDNIDLERNAFIDHRASIANSSSYHPRLKKKKKGPANKDVVIDVDALLEHVHQNNDTEIDYHDTDDEDEYNSRPSSKGSSSNSSLDDVFIDETKDAKIWPDVTILEEFSKEETERLRREAQKDAEAFPLEYDDTEEEDVFNSGSKTNDNHGNIVNNTTANTNNTNNILFSKPIVTNIDVPELGNKQVNEAEHLHSGRLRPKRIAPWHLIQRQSLINNTNYKDSKTKIEREMRDNLLVGRNIKYPAHIISNNPEHFRFTYFRIDLDSTVHSPTISGLLQPGQKFQDLFVSSVYAPQKISRRASTVGSMSPTTIPLNTTNSTLLLNQKNASTLSGNAPSQQQLQDEDIPPFWLDVVNPTEEEMKTLSKAFGIHPLTTEDIFLGEIREKVELFKDYYLICFRSFDIVAAEKKKSRHSNISRINNEKLYDDRSSSNSDVQSMHFQNENWFEKIKSFFGKKPRRRSSISAGAAINRSKSRRLSILKKQEKERFKRKSGDRHKPRAGELEPLNVYIIVFRTGVLTFHFAPTPHPINVRRRARLLKDYLNVTSDWIAYALIDDITDAFGPMIELIEDEVYDIEDAILKMHHGDDSSSSDSSDSSDNEDSDLYGTENEGSSDTELINRKQKRRRRRGLISSNYGTLHTGRHSARGGESISSRGSGTDSSSSTSSSSSSSSSLSTFNANLIGWKKKGDMLRRIGECRKRVMSILRLLGAKADVIKGFAKRYNGQWGEIAPQGEIAMYLDDIQDHIITMVSSLNHYEKLLSRSHSNYLAQINIDMTRVNNDMNDVLGKITILGTIVLPMNVITGLWGMNVLVPGQDKNSLQWFIGIIMFMMVLAYTAYMYTKRRFGF